MIGSEIVYVLAFITSRYYKIAHFDKTMLESLKLFQFSFFRKTCLFHLLNADVLLSVVFLHFWYNSIATWMAFSVCLMPLFSVYLNTLLILHGSRFDINSLNF